MSETGLADLSNQTALSTLHLEFVPLDFVMHWILPYGIYTIPEASMAGETEATLRPQGVDYVVGRAAYADRPRGQIQGLKPIPRFAPDPAPNSGELRNRDTRASRSGAWTSTCSLRSRRASSRASAGSGRP